MRSPDERRRRFEEIYAACHDPVLGYVTRRTSNGHDAADVLAETFLTAWRRLDDVPDGGQARPWLFGVARRTLANHHRGERRRTALSERLQTELSGLHQQAGDAPDLSVVAEAFQRLPDRERELLALADWEGLDAAEIAIALGCSRNAARIRLHRARRRLARELARGPDGHPATAETRTVRAGIAKGDLA